MGVHFRSLDHEIMTTPKTQPKSEGKPNPDCWRCRAGEWPNMPETIKLTVPDGFDPSHKS
jgi:hypothetical protein